MAFAYKKVDKELYLPKTQPEILRIPKMQYIIVRGAGDPNEENGEYKHSLNLLYPIAFTLKMSKKAKHDIAGYFEYVVPPLEGLWWQSGSRAGELDYTRKADLNFISMIRVPEFITPAEVEWAKATASQKKRQDFTKVEFWEYDEGECVQCMHMGAYDDEPVTIQRMHDYMKENGYALDISDKRYHHEIYLSDPRRCDARKLRTVV